MLCTLDGSVRAQKMQTHKQQNIAANIRSYTRIVFILEYLLSHNLTIFDLKNKQNMIQSNCTFKKMKNREKFYFAFTVHSGTSTDDIIIHDF